MHMKVTNLSSGSKGNCTFVCANNTKILVDIGIGIKLVESGLRELGYSADQIDAVLITHEHYDHVSGLSNFAKKYSHIKIYVNVDVWGKILNKYPELENIQTFYFIYDTSFSVGDFTCVAMKNFHDSISCASFILSEGGGKLGICTDLGQITDYQIEMLSDCKVVYLECNHDKTMLANCDYPKILKDRISGKYGHLSNDQCAVAAVKMLSQQTKVIVLSHLSENSNTPELAYARVMDEIEMSGIKNFHLLIAYPKKVSKTITIL